MSRRAHRIRSSFGITMGITCLLLQTRNADSDSAGALGAEMAEVTENKLRVHWLIGDKGTAG